MGSGMTPRHIALYALPFVLAACGQAAISDVATVHAPAAKPAAPQRAHARREAVKELAWTQRKPGDLFVHRFTGSFRQTPLTLTEHVIGYDDDLRLIVEYTLDEGEQSVRLRVRLDPETEKILEVAKMEGETEIPMSLAAYEALMAETVFSPDSNEGEIAADDTTCVIASDELDCKTTSYKVMVGDREATLSVTRSDGVPGRDVSGEIVGADGKVIYRAELIEIGKSMKGGSVAKR